MSEPVEAGHASRAGSLSLRPPAHLPLGQGFSAPSPRAARGGFLPPSAASGRGGRTPWRWRNLTDSTDSTSARWSSSTSTVISPGDRSALGVIDESGPFLLRLPPPGPQTQSDCQGPAAALTEPPGAWEQQTAVAHGRPGPGGRDRGAAGAGRPPGHTRPTPHSVLAWREQEPPGTPAFSHRGSDATCQGPHTGTRGPHANARSPTRREAETSAALSIPAAASSQRPRRFISGRPGDLPQAGGARGDAVTKRGVGRAGRPERRVGRGGLVRGATGHVVTAALRDASAIFL